MTVDTQALRETLDRVIDQAALGNWSQEHWFVPEGVSTWTTDADWDDHKWEPECGSGGCFLGHRAILDGAQSHGLEVGRAVLPDGTLLTHDFSTRQGHEKAFEWTDWGQVRFGISRITAHRLFDHRNSLEDLKTLVDMICAGEDVSKFQPENAND